VPLFRQVGPEARQRLTQASRSGALQRERFRATLSQLELDDPWEIQPAGGETIHQLKVNVGRAAKALGVRVRYTQTNTGALVVWRKPERRRRRRRRVAAATAS
jgi:hypothetical protein